jgi:pantetheine-phosphate adenylyltransferase
MTSISAKNAFYAGSFDPVTNGHLSIIQKSVQAFDRVVVAIGYNPSKKEMFSVDERIVMINQAIAGSTISAADQKKIEVIAYTNYSVMASIAHGCGSMVRGVRNMKDFEEENLLSTLNDSICDDMNQPRLQTHLYIADADKVGISSSIIKTMIGFPGWETTVKRYVPETVLKKLIEEYK